MKRTLNAFFATAAIAAAMSQVANAQDAQGFSLSFDSGEDAFTVEGSYQLNRVLSFRMPIGVSNQANGSYDAGDGISVGGLGFLADYEPGIEGLRFSGGAIISGGGLGSSAGGVLVNGTVVETNSASYATREETIVNPVISLGYERSFGSGWAVTGDLGAVFAPDDVAIGFDGGEQDTGGLDVVPYVRLGVTFDF
ncbi:MAG: hypothetical protein AAF667_08440 [Pseudomonadota bacterium]